SGAGINLTVTNVAARTQGGSVFLNSPTQGFTIGGAALGGLTGISAGAGNVTLTAGGTISEAPGGVISTGGLLTTSSVGGTTLGNANTVARFTASNSGAGNISLTNTGDMTITGITQNTGDVTA